MTPELNEKLTYVEVTLLNELQPDYLEVSFQQNFIYCLVSKREYMYYNLSERIYSIFELLKWNCLKILEEHAVIVEALDENELSSLFGMYQK